MTAKTWRGDLASVLVTVIFANGKDDDAEGMAAAIEDRRVLFEGRIYEPGELLEVTGFNLVFSVSQFRFPNGEGFPNCPISSKPIREVDPPATGRNVRVVECIMGWGLTPQP